MPSSLTIALLEDRCSLLIPLCLTTFPASQTTGFSYACGCAPFGLSSVRVCLTCPSTKRMRRDKHANARSGVASSPSLSLARSRAPSQISLTPHHKHTIHAPRSPLGRSGRGAVSPGLAVPASFPQRGSVEQVPGEGRSASTPPERHKAPATPRTGPHPRVIMATASRTSAARGGGGGHGTGRKLREQWAIISQPPPLSLLPFPQARILLLLPLRSQQVPCLTRHKANKQP